MNHIRLVAAREIRMGLRNPWAYSFIGIFAVFMMILLLVNAQGYVAGYSGVTGTMLNLVLYLLPLMTLMLGSFSLTGEKEDGGWELLSTYPLGTTAYIAGKYIGLTVVMLVIIFCGFGAAGVLGYAMGTGFQLQTYITLLGFSLSLMLMFLALAMLVGTMARNRWQALTISVALWFFLVIAWAPALIAVLGMLPYTWIKPAVTMLTALNPAELSRLFAVISLGGGSVLGPEYYDWVQWIRRPSGTIAYAAFALVWIGFVAGLANYLWERRRVRE